jgi:hypothetical protein
MVMTRKPNQLKTVSELTPKQRMFVDYYVENYGKATKVEAALHAGYTSKSKYGPTETASRLMNPDLNPHVVRYFEKRYAQELSVREKDKLRVYKRFENLSKRAEEKNQFAAAINAEFRAGQMAGHFIDKKEITHLGLEGMSREQLERRLEELENKIDSSKNIIDVTPEAITEKS